MIRTIYRSQERILITSILLISGMAHGLNMFGFPYVENDEGTYMSQAWAVTEIGELAPYTYWYDHAPLGWIQIAGWNVVTDGSDTFGSAIASGRAFMLVLQLASTFMVYRIARCVGQSPAPAAIAALLFATSAFGVHYHRRILLDNIASFWMLLSIVPLVSPRISLKSVWLSAMALSCSILSKEITIVLVPVILVLVFVQVSAIHRWFAVTGWSVIVGGMVSLYPLMALIKGEFFPSGSRFGGDSEHVSLLSTLELQASRDKDGGLLDAGSVFWTEVAAWTRDEPFLVVFGTACAFLSILTIRTRPVPGILGIGSLFLWAFLARGGVVISFYLLPLLPLLSLNVALVLHSAASATRAFMARHRAFARRQWLPIFASIVLCISGTAWSYGHASFLNGDPTLMWHNRQADGTSLAVQWIRENISPQSVLVIDQAMWMDLREVDADLVSYTNAHHYWKADSDPDVREDLLANDWRNIDYVVSTNQLVFDAERNNMTLILDALENSKVIARFDTGGWPVEIRRVIDPRDQGCGAASTLPSCETQQPAANRTRLTPTGQVPGRRATWPSALPIETNDQTRQTTR